jgi:hypothetical protein
MKLLFFLLFIPSIVFAVPLTLEWDPVTKNLDGTPAGPVVYNLYKRGVVGPPIKLVTKIATTYTWQVPQIGEWFFTVRALSKNGESPDSNEVHIVVDPCWTEIGPVGSNLKTIP